MSIFGSFGITSGDIIPERSSESFNYYLPEGYKLKDSLIIVNNDDIDHVFNLASYTAKISPNNQMSCNEDRDTSNNNWLSLDKQSVKIASESSEAIYFNFSTPNDALPGEHNFCLIASYSKNSQPTSDDTGVIIDTRIVMRVSVTIPGEFDWKLELGKPKVNINNNAVSLVVPQTNTGSASIKSKLSTSYDISLPESGHSDATGFIMAGSNADSTLNNLPKPFWGGFYRGSIVAQYLPSDSSLAGMYQPKLTKISFWYIVWPNLLAYVVYISTSALIFGGIHWLIKQKYRYKYKLHRRI